MQTFLLHTCCAPCSIAIVEELKDKFDLTVFFYNPNIFPEEEYLKRKEQVIKVCKMWNIKMIDKDYEHEKWREQMKGYEAEPEMGARCPLCFRFRLAKAVQYANENKFDLWDTSLTSGRNKKAEIIHPIANDLSQQFGVEFFGADWKKGGRQERGRKLTQEHQIYRQNYCGCEFSLRDKNKFQNQTTLQS